MFDFAWSELALIAVVALIVIGPKDLPRVMRTVGFWVRKARTVAREFQGSLEEMVREAELDEVREQVKKAASFNFDETIARHIDPHGEIKGVLDDPVLHNPMAELPNPSTTPEALPAPAAPPAEGAASVPELPSPEAPPLKTHDGGR